jgi:hypothetical protein
MSHLYLCTATGAFGIFSDYVWAKSACQAAEKFQQEKGIRPWCIRKAK